MTQNEIAAIITALHNLELGITNRLTSLEEKIKGQAELDDRLAIVESSNARLLVLMVVVGVIAFGDTAMRLYPFL